ncbi:MAG: T9SS type A sorting domain-containing protein [Saprospiraceae bacterium]|nr:T9SS type A sorting domain-containing protein [Saprospiraceae bacterium]
MLKLQQLLLSMLLIVATSQMATAQVFFTEDFEGTMQAAPLDIPAGWTETGNSTDGYWSTGTNLDATSAYVAFPAPTNGSTNFAYSNDDACNCTKDADRLILPAQNFSGMVGVNLTFDYVIYNALDVLTVEVSTNSGTSWTVVNTPAVSASWTNDYVVSLTAYAGQSNVWVSFKYNDGNTWAYAVAVDSIRLEQLASTDDLGVTSVSEYTMMPLAEFTGTNYSVTVENNGLAALSDVVVQTDLFLLSNMSMPVQSVTSSSQSVANGATLNFNNGTAMPTVAGDYLIRHIVSSASISDNNSSNDTAFQYMNIDATFARDNNIQTGSLGIGAGAGQNAFLGQNFTYTNSAYLDSVFVFIGNGPSGNTMVGQPVSVAVFSTSSSTPSTIIGSTDTVTVTTSGPHWVSLPINGGLTLSAGEYYFGAVESDSNLTIGTATSVFTAGKGWVTWNGNPNGAGVWSNSEDFNFNVAYMIRTHSGYQCPTIANTSSTTNASCGNADGSATVTASGGTGPYTYSWDAAAGNQATATATGLALGSYVVVITDSLGCSNSDTISVANANTPSLTVAVTSSYNGADISCDSSSNGEATATGSGGTGSLTYLWDPAAGSQATAIATGLIAGTYSVTVTDSVSCFTVESVTVNAPPAIVVIPDSIANVSCNGADDGFIFVTAIGGTGAFTYNWSNGATTDDVTGLVPGVYSGTLTDANGCTLISPSLPITEPAVLVSSIVDNGNGSATASATGGTAPYTYAWDSAAGNQTAATATGLVNNTYSCTITDANGCTSDTSVTITGVGFSSVEGLSLLNMYPNPADASLIVDIQLEDPQNVIIRVMNITGQVLIESNIGAVENKRTEIELYNLSNGIYTVQFVIGNETTSRKLIVNR